MEHSFSGLTILGIATILSFYMGRGARRIKFPSLIGYMILGVIMGPSILNFFNKILVDKLTIINQIVLGFVAFSIGAELNLVSLKRLGYGIVSIIISESFMAFLIVFGSLYLFTKDLPMALIFGAMAPASAPAGTVAVIQECRAKGNLTQALYAVVGFDDGLAIVIFGFAFALSKSLLVSEISGVHENIWVTLLVPLKEIALCFLVGGMAGFIFCQMIRFLESSRDILIVIFGSIFIVTGLALRFHFSLILSNMMLGFLLVNTRNEKTVKKVVAPLMEIMPLLFVWFFFLAGTHLEIQKLPQLGTIGILYIIGRSSGLIGGAFLGGLIGNVEKKIKKWIGLGILSQAGVAIGLSLIVKQEFSALGSPHADAIGTSVITAITATCIFFEIIGPILTKIALKRSGEIS
ncbi:MAG: cation:proton antiporter [Candidatus Aureabacteria bacterium]|nr:cation:proton antiporter [Candidatus Auribacterota bacterium]